MAGKDSVTYYKTWDNTTRRYLIKQHMDDQWRLCPTPHKYSTKGRTFNPDTGEYYPPPNMIGSAAMLWDATEGIWVYKVTLPVDMKEMDHENHMDKEENSEGVDIIAVREKYF